MVGSGLKAGLPCPLADGTPHTIFPGLSSSVAVCSHPCDERSSCCRAGDGAGMGGRILLTMPFSSPGPTWEEPHRKEARLLSGQPCFLTVPAGGGRCMGQKTAWSL